MKSKTVGQGGSIEPKQPLSEKVSESFEIKKATFTEAETAKYLNVSPSTLRRGRMEGHRLNHFPCPPYVRLGRAIRYLISDLDAWLKEHRVVDPRMVGAGDTTRGEK
jgi:predicted DNA-binding transcriptional regulator AlpA